jgi:putative phosphoesterase
LTRILIFSDLHANWEALLALLAAVPDRPDAVFFLGDAVGYGPDAKLCVEWLARHVTHAVRGNHDHALFDHAALDDAQALEGEAEATLLHARRVLGAADLDFLRALPQTAAVELAGARFFLAHGSPANPLYGRPDLLLTPQAKLREMLDGVEADFVLLGHTHIPALRQVGHTLIVNPGSLGQPRYGSPDGTFALWEDGRVQIHHLHYDHETTQAKLALLPLAAEQRHRLQHTLATGQWSI